MIKYGSRKFIVVVVQWLQLMLLPILFKHYGIETEVLMMVLGASGGLSGLYLGVNVMEKKVNPNA